MSNKVNLDRQMFLTFCVICSLNVSKEGTKLGLANLF